MHGVVAFSWCSHRVTSRTPNKKRLCMPTTPQVSMSQSNLSPRRVKPATVTVLYELRALRSHPPAAYVSRFEAKVRRWRGLQRWTMQAHTSTRGETVLHVIAEKTAQSSRIDNAFSSWRRLLQQLLPVAQPSALAPAKAIAAWARACWISGDGQQSSRSLYADVRLLAETYDAACAKLWEEARRVDVGATRCSYLEPAMPVQIRRVPQDGICDRTAISTVGGENVGAVSTVRAGAPSVVRHAQISANQK